MTTTRPIREHLNKGTTEFRSPALSWILLAAIAATLFAIRLLAPPNLLDQDQERPASYVLDAVKNGNWICQRDWTGDITSKPPMWTWLAAMGAVVLGRVNEASLYWPGAAAALGCAWLVYGFGRKVFGHRAALIAGIACLVSTAAAKQIGLARTDGVFAFMVTLTALLGYRAWQSGKGWTWFWVAAAGATLTKGPLGLVLGAFGLVAAAWEKRTGHSAAIRGSHVPGVLLYIGICGGWFALAYMQFGDALVAKMLGKELAGHALSSGKKNLPGTLIYQQPLYYLGRALPWSVLAYLGLWSLWRSPAAEDRERQFERYVACWFGLGLLLFSLAPHQRADLLWPILPAGALLAGRQLSRLVGSRRNFNAVFTVCVLAGVAGLAWYYFVSAAAKSVVRQTAATRELARQVISTGREEFPLTHVDDPMTFQVYLNTMRTPVKPEVAASLLRQPLPAFVAVSDLEAIRRGYTNLTVHVLASTPAHFRKRSVSILSNRPNWETREGFAFGLGNLVISVVGAELESANARGLVLQGPPENANVQLRNNGSSRALLQVTFRNGDVSQSCNAEVAPGGLWSNK